VQTYLFANISTTLQYRVVYLYVIVIVDIKCFLVYFTLKYKKLHKYMYTVFSKVFLSFFDCDLLGSL